MHLEQILVFKPIFERTKLIKVIKINRYKRLIMNAI